MPLGRRRENRVSSCLACGAVLCVYTEGEMPKTEAHACEGPTGELYEYEETLEAMREARGEEEA